MTARAFVRVLRLDLPFDRGLDVLALQQRLADVGAWAGTPDGVYGPQTAASVRAWQNKQGIPASGICDEAAWNQLFPEAANANTDRIGRMIGSLLANHRRFPGGCEWRLAPDGIQIGGNSARGTGGEPVTIRRIWTQFGEAITKWSTRLGVPAELIVATIATGSGGKPDAIRFEPKYVSDEVTPHQVSPGLMQTLISTARETLANPGIDRSWLLIPENAIQAGTAYILKQSARTSFDPPVVACCYNAGDVILNESPSNPWQMQQYPIGTGEHCDRFVGWFNDCMKVFAGLQRVPPVSFTALLGATSAVPQPGSHPADPVAALTS